MLKVFPMLIVFLGKMLSQFLIACFTSAVSLKLL